MAVLLGSEREPDGVAMSAEADFGELYRRWQPEVVRLCRKLLGGLGDAEDAAQEAFLRAWSAREQYSSMRPFWPWVATIAHRLCVDQRRRRTRERLDRALVEPPSPSPSHPAPELVVVLGDDLRIVLDELRPLEKRVLWRRHVHGWSYHEIAVDEGVTVETVRGSLKRARASVRQSLAASPEMDVPDSLDTTPSVARRSSG